MPTVVFEDDSGQYELHPKVIADLSRIATRNNLSLAAAAQQAVINEKYLLDLEADGYQLLIQEADGSIHYLDRA